MPKTSNKKRPKKPEVEAENEDDHYIGGEIAGRAYLSGPGIENMPVDYVVEDGHAFCCGCIELGPEDEVTDAADDIEAAIEARNADGDFDAELQGVGLPTTSSKLWPNGVVYYTINPNVPDQDRVLQSIQHIQQNTAIRFVQRTTQSNYVEVVSNGNLGWSSSRLGMVGGRQLLRFSNRHSVGVCVHEWLHALGVFHEQTRSDRDNYVDIVYSNINPDFVSNFNKSSSSVDYYDYDYNSIMHYGPGGFAIDRTKPTIVPKQPGVTIGQRSGMSYGDRQTIAKMYSRFFQRGYTGVWRAGSGRYGLWVNASWSSFHSKWQEWSRQGLRLHDIQVRRTSRGNRYSGVFRPGSGRYGLWANVDWTSFRNKWQQWSSQGLRLVDLHIHRANGQNRYSGVFLPGSGAYGLWVNASWSSFHNKWQEWSRAGMRLTDIHVQNVGGSNRYSGVFVAGSGRHALWANASWSSFRSKWQQLSGQGLRLVDINLHRVNGQMRYSGAFLPGSDSYYLFANVTWEGFRAKWQELAAKGLRLTDFELPSAGSGSADMADGLSFEDDLMVGDDEEAMEPFGGIFEGEPEEEPDALPGEEQDSHGGLVLDAEGDAVSIAEEGGLGSAVFGDVAEAAPYPDTSSEEADGLGGEYFGNAAMASGNGAMRIDA